MCSRLVAEAPFLVDGPTMAAAAAADSPAAAEGIKAECILRAVGCTSDADVAELVEYFFTPKAGGDGDEDDDDADAAAESESTRDGALALARGQCTVPPGGVVRTVLRFVEARAAAEREAAAATDPFGEGGGGARHVRPGPSADVVALLRRAEEEGGVSAPPSAQGLDEVSRAQQQEAEYWSKLVNTVPPRTVRVWRVLEQGLSKYVATLSRRSKVMEEVSGLKAQNAELKGLLQQYLGARVNKELQVPPTQTIRGAGGGGGTLASRGGGGGLGVSGLRMATPGSTASSRAGRGTTREGKR
ncbi:DRC1 [Symbiodinium sp. KB8]|nr:DRC1 [Symbiodinium sp. KB8]